MNARGDSAAGLKSKIAVRAFTVLELMVVVAAAAILLLVYLPGVTREGCKCTKINCVNNLKQIAIASAIWVDDNGNYPIHTYTNADGGPLYIGSSLFINFQSMSNELNTPKVVICPEDRQRTTATNFIWDFNNTRLSYFLALNVDPTRAGMLLSGDRNIDNGIPPSPTGVLVLDSKSPLRWTRALHKRKGNIAFNEGSVLNLTSSELNKRMALTGTNTIPLALP